MNKTLRNILYKNIGEKTLLSWEVPAYFHLWTDSVTKSSPLWEKYIEPLSKKLTGIFNQYIFISKNGIYVNNGEILKFSSVKEFGVVETSFKDKKITILSLIIYAKSDKYEYRLFGIAEDVSKQKIIKVLSSYIEYNDNLEIGYK